MAYDVKSFRAWATYYDVAQELSPKEQGQFYRALFEYMFSGNDLEESLPKTARICFKSIKPNLKRSKSKAKANDLCEDGAEMVRSTSHENETKNALNLNSNLNIRSKKTESGASRAETAASGLPSEVAFPCPYCKQETVAKYSEPMGSYSVQCKCGADFAMSPGAVALAIERAAS